MDSFASEAGAGTAERSLQLSESAGPDTLLVQHMLQWNNTLCGLQVVEGFNSTVFAYGQVSPTAALPPLIGC